MLNSCSNIQKHFLILQALNEVETHGDLLEPIIEKNCDNVCYLSKYMLYVMFLSLGE